MTPACGDPMEALGLLNCGVLVRLKISARNCNERLPSPPNPMLRNTEKSSCIVPGPNTVLRPTLPKVNCGGAVKHAVLNQRSTVESSSFGSQPATASGR